MDAYVKEWLDYQSLWVLLPDALVIKFGEDISKWMRLLSDIKKSRATSNTYETKKEFGPVVIDYAKVQSKVSLIGEVFLLLELHRLFINIVYHTGFSEDSDQ